MNIAKRKKTICMIPTIQHYGKSELQTEKKISKRCKGRTWGIFRAESIFCLILYIKHFPKPITAALNSNVNYGI
jgi:hypothetical protein